MLSILRGALALMSKQDRIRWGLVALLAILVSAMESFGLVAILAVIQLVTNPDLLSTTPVISTIYAFVGQPDRTTFLILLCLGTALFYLGKNAFLYFALSVQNRVIFGTAYRFCADLFAGYLRAPYVFFFGRNTSELSANLIGATDFIFLTVGGAVLTLFSELLVTIGLLSVLFIADPKTTLVVLGFLFLLLLPSHLFLRKRFSYWGSTVMRRNRETLQWVAQTMGAIKEIKVLGREHFFSSRFADIRRDFAHVQEQRSSLGQVPRLLLEGVVVAGVLVLVAVLVAQGQTAQSFLPMLGGYAYAGFRIMPSLTKILTQINNLRFGGGAVDFVADDYKTLVRDHPERDHDGPQPRSGLHMDHAVELRDVSYTYPGTEQPALASVSMVLRKGATIGVVGSSGAGKSTLVDVLLGLLEPQQGQFLIDGQPMSPHLRAWQDTIGYVPQSINLIDDSIRRNIALGVAEDAVDNAALEQAIRMAQLSEVVAALPDGLDTTVGERGIRLSGGQRQRIGIARALYDGPDVLIMDEATSALDSETEADITRTITNLCGQVTMVIIAHRLSTVRHCDELLFMKAGNIVDRGRFDDLYRSNQEFRYLVDLGRLTVDTPQ